MLTCAVADGSAKGDVGLIVTGGVAPNRAGRVSPLAAKLTTKGEVRAHQEVTQAVHAHGGKIAMQILHSGRYGYHPFNVAPSAIKAPIGWFTPKALSAKAVENTIRDYAQCAVNAREAGYDGVEIMGSEGYLINQVRIIVDAIVLVMGGAECVWLLWLLAEFSSSWSTRTSAKTSGVDRMRIAFASPSRLSAACAKLSARTSSSSSASRCST